MGEHDFERKIEKLERETQDLQERTRHSGVDRDLDLNTTLNELAAALEELHVASEELRQQNDELVAARGRLERERQRFLDLFQSAPHAYLATDMAGKIGEANRVACELLGLKNRALVGKPLAVFVPKEARAEFRKLLAAVAGSQRSETWQLPLAARGGSVFDAAITVSVKHWGEAVEPQLLWMIRDVTANRRAMDLLRESEERFRSVAEMLPIPMAITRRKDGAILYGNAAYSRVLGLPVTKLVGRKASEFYVQGEDRTRVLARLDEDGVVEGVEIESKRVDGSQFWAVASYAAISFGGEDALVTAFRDITESKHLEQERERLLGQTAEMAEALRVERDLLETLMESTDAQIAYLDPDFNFIQVNSAYEKGCGYTRNILVGKNHFELFPDEENQAIFEQVRDTAEPVEFRARPFTFPQHPELGTTYWDWTLSPVLGADEEVQGLVLSLADVTDHECTRMELDAERARLKAIIDHAPEAIVVTDEACRVILTNPVADKLYGGAFPLGETWGSQTELKLCHPDGTPYDPQQLPLARSALEGLSSADGEMSVVRPDGENRDLMVSTAPIRDVDGRLSGAVGVFQDITDRKRTREALRRAAERLSLLHDLDSFILTAPPLEEVVQSALDRIPLMVPCLRASVALFHVTNGHFSLLAVYSGEDTQLERGWRGELDSIGFLEDLREGKAHLIQDLQVSTDAAPKWTQLRAEGIRSYVAVPLLAEGVLMGSLNMGLPSAEGLSPEELEIVREVAEQVAVAVHQDRLREQVRLHTEELESLVEERTVQLRASEERFRTIFEGTAIGVALVDLEDRVLESNPALQQMTGYSGDEMRGLPFSRLDHPSDRAANLAGYREFVRGEEDHLASERRFVRSNGDLRWARLTLSLVRADSGRALHTIAVVEDITEEKDAQEALIKAEKLAVTGRLAASLAHEINNPLQAVIGCLGLAQESLADGEDVDRYLDVGLEELRRAADVVTRLRQVQRASEPGQRKPVNLRTVLERTGTLTRKRCEERGVLASLSCSEELPLVNADEGRLQQVFLNLILNAVDAMEEGGELRIVGRATEDPAGVCVEFADTGIGIEAELMQTLFDPFVTTKEQGLGLGLYVSQNIVEEYGGQIDADSQSGEGTTFTVWLPC